MQESPAGSAVKPLPKPAQYVIVAILLALTGGVIWLLRPGSKACTTRSYSKESDGTMCFMEGKVARVDEANRQLNAVNLEEGHFGKRTALDYFEIVDGEGTASVYFDPSTTPMPAEGARVKIRARIVTQSENQARRLVLESSEEPR
jgi:hypothetical protein